MTVCMTEVECPEKCEDALSSLGRAGNNLPGNGLPGNKLQESSVFGRSKVLALLGIMEDASNGRKTNVLDSHGGKWGLKRVKIVSEVCVISIKCNRLRGYANHNCLYRSFTPVYRISE